MEDHRNSLLTDLAHIHIEIAHITTQSTELLHLGSQTQVHEAAGQIHKGAVSGECLLWVVNDDSALAVLSVSCIR